MVIGIIFQHIGYFRPLADFFIDVIFLILLHFKSIVSGLRQVLAIESSLKMMTNAFYFTSKAIFVLKIFKYLS